MAERYNNASLAPAPQSTGLMVDILIFHGLTLLEKQPFS